MVLWKRRAAYGVRAISALPQITGVRMCTPGPSCPPPLPFLKQNHSGLAVTTSWPGCTFPKVVVLPADPPQVGMLLLPHVQACLLLACLLLACLPLETPPVPQGCSQTPSLPGHCGHIAITHRNTLLAAHTVCVELLFSTDMPLMIFSFPKWIQAQLPFFTQLNIIQGWINWSTGCDLGCCTYSIHSVV